MIRATIEGRGGVHKIECIGHATGSEQMCAAVSGIMMALAGYLVNHNNKGIRHMNLASGNNLIVFKGSDAAFEMAKIGLLQIAQSYPQYFCIFF